MIEAEERLAALHGDVSAIYHKARRQVSRFESRRAVEANRTNRGYSMGTRVREAPPVAVDETPPWAGGVAVSPLRPARPATGNRRGRPGSARRPHTSSRIVRPSSSAAGRRPRAPPRPGTSGAAATGFDRVL